MGVVTKPKSEQRAVPEPPTPREEAGLAKFTENALVSYVLGKVLISVCHVGCVVVARATFVVRRAYDFVVAWSFSTSRSVVVLLCVTPPHPR